MATTTTLEKPIKAPTFRHVSTGRRIKNNLATGAFAACFAIAMIPLVWVLWMVISKGITAIASATWWTNSQKGILPDQTGGGVYHAIYGTIVQSAVAAVIAVPLGVMAAIYLVEYGRGRLAKVTTFMVDILAGVPSIVAALFIFALWIATLGFPQSAFAVSLAMVLLMLPVVVRSTEEMLKLVPDELREASYALGIPKWKTVVKIVVPTALPGMISGILLSLARVMGETAPVLVLVGYAKSINSNLFDGNMASLPLLIYQELANPEAAGRERVWGAALTLILLIALLYAAAAVVNKLLTRNR
ncbi:phosphate ABC transporter permease PstA [Nocardia sp. XZ_19_385]|uniref:phosphate ABC transporter permease PstA n=1 Tax=Nocardia sp. XZ_19_385 TaxID=2769488 RepID=UPI00188EA75F|nr:phosphate ABC transporter permease PstA [Nocardia sp. XZ_19_385]